MTKRKETAGRLSWAQWDFDAWETDAELAACSMGAQGLWMRLLCLGWKNDGYVLVSGKPPSTAVLARLVRESEADVEKWLNELLENKVASVQNWPGASSVLFSRRMVRELKIRKAARENGAKGGNPNLKPAPDESRKNPATGQRKKASSDGAKTGNPGGVNLEIEREIEIESESRANPKNTGEPKNRATWDSLEYRGDTLRTVLEAEKAGEKRTDPEGRKGEVWFMAKGVLAVLGGMSEAEAGKAVGEISRRHGLDPDEVATIALSAFEFGPNNPRAYFASQAGKIAARRI